MERENWKLRNHLGSFALVSDSFQLSFSCFFYSPPLKSLVDPFLCFNFMLCLFFQITQGWQYLYSQLNLPIFFICFSLYAVSHMVCSRLYFYCVLLSNMVINRRWPLLSWSISKIIVGISSKLSFILTPWKLFTSAKIIYTRHDY